MGAPPRGHAYSKLPAEATLSVTKSGLGSSQHWISPPQLPPPTFSQACPPIVAPPRYPIAVPILPPPQGLGQHPILQSSKVASWGRGRRLPRTSPHHLVTGPDRTPS